VEPVILDEAERLNTIALDYLRDLFDRNDIGIILIGMPGIEKRTARYPQLYSRVGFAHHYRPLLGDELSFVLAHHWQKLGLQLDGADFTDTQAVASIARITGGNFRLLRRPFLQIERVLQVNELTVITDDVVNAARSTLVIGVSSPEESPPHSSERHTLRQNMDEEAPQELVGRNRHDLLLAVSGVVVPAERDAMLHERN
jgi:DNA transposition AAA+ family ATPase